MANSNCTDIVYLREILKERGPDIERAFLSNLPEDLKSLYMNASYSTWTPTSRCMKVLDAAAETFFPEDPERYFKNGKTIANRVFSGIHRIFIRVTNVDFIFKRAPNVWRAYHDEGKVTINYITDNKCDFSVGGYPDMSFNMREYVRGYLTAILEVIGEKNVNVELANPNPNEWKWIASWDKESPA